MYSYKDYRIYMAFVALLDSTIKLLYHSIFNIECCWELHTVQTLNTVNSATQNITTPCYYI